VSLGLLLFWKFRWGSVCCGIRILHFTFLVGITLFACFRFEINELGVVFVKRCFCGLWCFGHHGGGGMVRTGTGFSVFIFLF